MARRARRARLLHSPFPRRAALAADAAVVVAVEQQRRQHPLLRLQAAQQHPPFQRVARRQAEAEADGAVVAALRVERLPRR